MKSRHRLSGQLVDLQGTDDSLGVVRVKLPGAFRIDLKETIVQVDGGARLSEAASKGFVSRWGLEKSLRQGAQIKAGASDKQSRSPSLQDPLDRFNGMVQIVSDREPLVGRDDVEKMMGDRLTGMLGWLGRSDVHSPVDLHRIERDNLGLEKRSDLHRRAVFTAGCRSDEKKNQGPLHREGAS